MTEHRVTKEGIDLEAGISNPGSTYRIRRLFRRAQQGEALKTAFIGGSITQGSLASKPEFCYAARVFDWWKKTFPKSSFTYINAGIGGTTSQFGCARVYEDVLSKEPDFVVVEFSVNDDSTELFLETYESLVRRILSAPCRPAVLLVHSVYYNSGANAQVQHAKIARHYQIPSVSMQSSIYPQIVNGSIPEYEITPDGLHPNDNGHRLVSEVIIHFLQKLLEEPDGIQSDDAEIRDKEMRLPRPLTADSYASAVRIQNHHCPSIMEGFQADMRPQQGITDVFKNGWLADRPGARIVFEAEASQLAVQYRKSVKKPAPSAKAVIDGNEENAILLDGSFDENWGDCLYLQTLLHHGEYKKHTVAVTLLPPADGQKPVVPFYLVSLIAADNKSKLE